MSTPIADFVYEELVKFRSGPIRRAEGPTQMLQYLTEQGYIRSVETGVFDGLSLRPVAWEITIEGKVALLEFEAIRAKEAQQKVQQNFDNKVSIASILVPLISFILGLLVEHFSGIVAYTVSLLG